MAEHLNAILEIPPAIDITDQAAAKVYELLQEEDNKALSLRIYVTGGGCSGMKYGFTFDDKIDPNDTLVEKSISSEGHIRVLIDPISFQYLSGAKIDFEETVSDAQFIIKNPNAKTTCGCGSSFTVEE